MRTLLIPIAPLSRTKSRLRDCFTTDQLKNLTICMFKDLCNTLSKVSSFDIILVYCNNEEILDIAENHDLIGIKEVLTKPRKSFDEVINDLNNIAINDFDANETVFTFLDLILISEVNFNEISKLMDNCELLICPCIHSAGISVLGRKPPDIMESYFSDPQIPSFIAQLSSAKKKGLTKISIYDSFRAGFDIDIKQDLVLGYEYLKILDMQDTYTYKFLDENLNLSVQKLSLQNNREFKIVKE
ncbi:MAG: hypothetical protein GF317_00905 [Candidatus Lokiarchaeota archaeon]|nr:hypothetical protein [Candidatus Lokiarchaeota archaeon]MBD3198520.1 hypothetical protein [Candidatus Lokiarchaeota archaeon]